MSKPFDATPKWLVELRPADWPAFLGVAARAVEVLDADVSTVTAATDKVLRVRSGDGDRIQHFDFQSGPDASVPTRTHGYSTLLEARHGLAVDSVVVLLHRKANLRSINGLYERWLPGETEPYLRFRYRVVRVWELPVETVLQAGISVLPLAPISAVRRDELPRVIGRMKQQLDGLSDLATAGKPWTATKVLLGLNYQPRFVDQLLKGVRAMKESATYQAIVEEGRVEELHEVIRLLGEQKFRSPPPNPIQTALNGMVDLTELKRTVQRILDVDTWEALLTPPPAPSPPQGPTATRPTSARRRKKP
jgi:predicted transposase YdaD